MKMHLKRGLLAAIAMAGLASASVPAQAADVSIGLSLGSPYYYAPPPPRHYETHVVYEEPVYYETQVVRERHYCPQHRVYYRYQNQHVHYRHHHRHHRHHRHGR